MSVENSSMRTHRKINHTIKLKCSDINKLEAAIKETKSLLSHCAEIDNEKIADCFISNFDDSSIHCEIVAFTKLINKLEFYELKQKIMIKIVKIFAKHKLYFQ